MDVYELSREEINYFLRREEVVGQGVYGIVLPYNDELVIKLYYKDFIDGYIDRNIDTFENNILRNIEVEKIMFESKMIDNRKLEMLVNNFSKLKITKCGDLIQGIVTYKEYPIGILLRNYVCYNKLSDIYNHLLKVDLEWIFGEIKRLLNDLEEYGIYPGDIKEDNVLVKKDGNIFDVKIIDLDDVCTRYEEWEYVNDHPHIKKRVIESYNEMKRRLKTVE